MSWLKSLFGGGSGAARTPPSPSAREDYKGYTIEAMPYPKGGQYQLSGIIRKEIDGVVKEHKFVRADRFALMADAASFTLVKGRQIIDQQGDRLFSA
jgi:hypothetical protein